MSKLNDLIQQLCPDGVEYGELGRLCKIETGKLNANAASENGPYLFFTTAKEISRTDTYRWDAEALLVAGNANVGDVKYYNGKFDAYQRTYVLTNFDATVSAKYLFYVLSNSLKQHLDRHTQKAAMTYIVLSALEQFRIPLPPLEIQQEIVKILDKFTEYDKELQAELQNRLKQYEYYRDKLLNFDEIAPRGGVEYKKLGEIGQFYGGLTGKNKSDFVNGNAKFITYKNAYSNISLCLDATERVKILPKEKQHNLRYGDIIFTGSSETPEECGFSSVVTETVTEPTYLNSFCFFLRLYNPEILLPNFSKFLFRSCSIRKQIVRTASGVTRFNISKKLMQEVKIPIPSLSEQRRIAEALDKFDKICSDLRSGLPAEIENRQKQYEFYRDKLLALPEKK